MHSVPLSLHITRVALINFRCFEKTTVDLDSPIILLCGFNGTGKTSFLEALHYSCYLKSFRTHLSRDIVALEKNSFFIKVSLNDNAINRTISIGFSNNKRLVKIDNKSALSYKELLQHYRVISLTEDDLMLIKGSPDERRIFLDQALFLYDYSFISILREFKIVLQNRNSLLQGTQFNQELYEILSQQLWKHTHNIQNGRKQLLANLEHEVQDIITHYFNNEFSIFFVYRAKKNSDYEYNHFLSLSTTLKDDELRFRRSLFGAHLDDIDIVFEGKKSKTYASRGQQKLVILLIKVAQMRLLTRLKGPGIFLLDDFMTDFDPLRARILISILTELGCQLIFTSPSQDSAIERIIAACNVPYKVISI